MRFVLQNYLPDAASDTLLESFVLFSIIFFLTAGVGVSIVAAVPSEAAAAANTWCWVILAAIWVGGHLFFVWRARHAMQALLQPPKPNSSSPPPRPRTQPQWRRDRLSFLRAGSDYQLASASLDSDNARSVFSPGLQDLEPFPIEERVKGLLRGAFREGNASGGLPHLSGSNRRIGAGALSAGGGGGNEAPATPAPDRRAAGFATGR